MNASILKQWLVYCTGILHSEKYTSEQKFSMIFESGVFTHIQEVCILPEINHEEYSNLGSVKALCDMLDKKHSYLLELEGEVK